MGQLQVDPELSLLLASEAMKAQRTPEAVDALRQAIAESRVRATFTGHDGPIAVVEYSADGSRLLTASYDGTARIWDLAEEADPIVLSGHTDLLVGASFNADGTEVATASFDGTARVWDAITGSPLATLEGDGGAVYDAAFTPDGAEVVTGDGSGTAAVWDLETGHRIHVLEGHLRPIYDVDVSVDGALALTASDDGTAKIWDLESGELVRTLEGHSDGLYVARFSPDASTVVTGSEDSSARLWDAGSGEEIRSLLTRGPVVDAAFGPAGDRVAIASEDHAARIWDTTSGQALVLRGHQDELNSVAFDPDGSMVVTTSNDGTARVWDARRGTTVAVLRGHEGQVLDASFSPDGTFVASAGVDGTARVWEPSSGRQVLGTRVWTMSQSPDGTQVAVATIDGHVVVIDARSGDELMDVDAGQTQIGAVITADGKLVVSASTDGIGHVWDIATGDPVADLVGHEPGWTVPVPVAVPDRALTFSDDGTARLWDPRTGEGIATFEHGGPAGVGIGDAALSADGSHVVTGGAAQDAIGLWDAGNGDQVWEVDDLLSRFQGISVNLNPNGSSLVAVTGQTEILDAKDGHRIAVLDAPELITNARFSPDGRLLVTYSNDGPLRIWDAKTGDLTATMPGEASSVDARFSHDGRWVVAVERDGPIRIWDPASGSAIASIDAARGALRAYFVAGDRSIVSNDGQGVRIDRCDVCSSVDELTHLADARVTRAFTDGERRAYLGDVSGTTADEEARPAGLVDANGREVEDGQLPAGTYSAVGFTPSLTFTVPEGWIATGDIGWASVGEAQVANSVALQDSDVAAPWLQFLNLEPGRVMDGWKEWDERLNVIPFPTDLATWVDDHPHLELLQTGSVEIGGFAGVAVDFRVSSLQEENLPPMCGDCLPTMPLTLSNQTGPLGNDLFGGVPARQRGTVDRGAYPRRSDPGDDLLHVGARPGEGLGGRPTDHRDRGDRPGGCLGSALEARYGSLAPSTRDQGRRSSRPVSRSWWPPTSGRGREDRGAGAGPRARAGPRRVRVLLARRPRAGGRAHPGPGRTRQACLGGPGGHPALGRVDGRDPSRDRGGRRVPGRGLPGPCGLQGLRRGARARPGGRQADRPGPGPTHRPRIGPPDPGGAELDRCDRARARVPPWTGS